MFDEMATGSTINMTPCTRCGETVPTEQATAYRVVFTTIGKPVTTRRSRTVAWLCSVCLNEDEVWNTPPYTSPGESNHATVAAARRDTRKWTTCETCDSRR